MSIKLPFALSVSHGYSGNSKYRHFNVKDKFLGINITDKSRGAPAMTKPAQELVSFIQALWGFLPW